MQNNIEFIHFKFWKHKYDVDIQMNTDLLFTFSLLTKYGEYLIKNNINFKTKIQENTLYIFLDKGNFTQS